MTVKIYDFSIKIILQFNESFVTKSVSLGKGYKTVVDFLFTIDIIAGDYVKEM